MESRRRQRVIFDPRRRCVFETVAFQHPSRNASRRTRRGVVVTSVLESVRIPSRMGDRGIMGVIYRPACDIYPLVRGIPHQRCGYVHDALGCVRQLETCRPLGY